jgi:inner membrane protein involved in colicin E2 resistance
VEETLKPQELSVEFSISFEGTGKAQVIPVLVTAETKASTGLKVTAVWKHTQKS